jgi:hypothetical protein
MLLMGICRVTMDFLLSANIRGKLMHTPLGQAATTALFHTLMHKLVSLRWNGATFKSKA